MLHVLRKRYYWIRYYGILSSRNRKSKLAKCQQILTPADTKAINTPQSLEWDSVLAQLLGYEPKRCPQCGEGYLSAKTSLRR